MAISASINLTYDVTAKVGRPWISDEGQLRGVAYVEGRGHAEVQGTPEELEQFADVLHEAASKAREAEPRLRKERESEGTDG